MFERFTERARQVVVMAQEEARVMGSGCIDEGHLLLGLIREEEGLAARVLEALHVDLDATRERLMPYTTLGEDAPTGQIPFTKTAKEIMELSLREALSLGHNYIGTEHLLLGLSRKMIGTQGPTTQVLDDNGATDEKIRNEVMRLLTCPRGKLSQEEQAEAAYEGAHEYELAKTDELTPGWYVETWDHDGEGTLHGPWENKPEPNVDAASDLIAFTPSQDFHKGPILWLTISSYASIALSRTEEDPADD